jgi:hypothetical protein
MKMEEALNCPVPRSWVQMVKIRYKMAGVQIRFSVKAVWRS